MKFFPSITALSIALFASATPQISAAQTNAPTPRQTFTSFATDAPLSELKFKPLNVPAPVNTPPIADAAKPAGDLPPADTQPSPAQNDFTEDVSAALPGPASDVAEILEAALPPAQDLMGKAESAPTSRDVTSTVKDDLNTPAEQIPAPGGTVESLPSDIIETNAAISDLGSVKNTPGKTPPQTKKETETEVPSDTSDTEIDETPPPAKQPATDLSENSRENAEDTSTAPLEMAGSTPKSKSVIDPGLLPFYSSASEYLSARGREKQTHLELKYKVTIANIKTGLPLAAKTRTITLGPDFAAAEDEDETRIFDFKTNRLLTIRSAGGQTTFDNISLYAGALKNVNSVNRATKNGKVSEVDIGPNAKLDAFWLEASQGWAARGTFDGLSVKRDGAKVTASYDDLVPFEASLSGPDMPSEDHMRVLFAWWNHDVPIHPAILPQIGKPDRAPKSMTVLSFSPKFPSGLSTTWELKSSNTRTAKFPLPKSAKTSIEAGKSSPLAFAIAQAAKGKAMAKRPSNDDLRDEIHAKTKAGKTFEAWLTAQTLSDRLGGCAKDPALLCKDISELEADAEPGSDLEKLPKIIRKTRKASSRAEGFTELAPYIEDKIAPAFLVKIAGQARARIQSSELEDADIKALRADSLLEEALVKNPYDPILYRTLGQVYAAQDRLAESWDMQDALRKLPNVEERLSDPINWAERSLLVRAPGFFLQENP